MDMSGGAPGSFGDLLRRRRQAAGLTQEDLAERSGLSARAIRDMERGHSARPYSRSVRLLADALQLPDRAREQLLITARAGQDPVTCAVVPRQLPPSVRHFTAREAELKALTSLLDDPGRPGAAAVISAISGTAGVGKTALAVRWAHSVAGRFPDGQLYVNLRGFDPSGPPLTPADAIRGFLDALGVPPAGIPAGPDAQVGLYRSLLSGRRMLLLLDNARDAEHVRPLMPGSSACMTVVTSRDQLAGLIAVGGAWPITLDVLTDAEACRMLAGFLGPERVGAELPAVEQVIGLCARLPLALSIAAARAAMRPGLPLAELARDLSGRPEQLDGLGTGEAASDVRAALSWSYQQLGRPAARVFRLLGVHAGPDITARAAASLAGLPLPAARRLLGELTRAHLIAEHAGGRYCFHDLLRAYATELALLRDSDADRRAAVHRVLDHYLQTAQVAAYLLSPARERLAVPPARPGVTPEELPDQAAALAWLEASRPALLRAIAQAAGAGFDRHAWQLPWAMTDFLDRRGYWDDWAATQETALAAARRLGDRAGQAHAHRYISRARFQLARYDDAHAHLLAALELRQQLGDLPGEASLRLDIGRIHEQRASYADALGSAAAALRLYRAADHRIGEAHALNVVGWYQGLRGHYDQALRQCRQALDLSRELGHQPCEANTWDSLGYAHQHLGHHAEAVACYEHAVAIYQRLGNRYHQAVALVHLGAAQAAHRSVPEARAAWGQALEILTDLRHADAEQVRAQLDGLDQVTSAVGSG
jgi:tetratricopeptide (TPR) repeat protein/transcriptional regulator with XRE-family HTH domain